jgi:hypothetical protein
MGAPLTATCTRARDCPFKRRGGWRGHQSGAPHIDVGLGETALLHLLGHHRRGQSAPLPCAPRAHLHDHDFPGLKHERCRGLGEWGWGRGTGA